MVVDTGKINEEISVNPPASTVIDLSESNSYKIIRVGCDIDKIMEIFTQDPYFRNFIQIS